MSVWGEFQESLIAYDAYDIDSCLSHEHTEPVASYTPQEPVKPHRKG